MQASPAHVALVLDAVAAATPACPGVTVVAIDGPSGSGKSTLGTAVARALDATLVRMDDLYPGWDGLAAAVDLLVERILVPLCRGEQAAVPTWDWVANVPAEPRSVPPVDVLVVEGAGSSVGRAGTLAAVRVWVEAEPTLRRARGIARDGAAYEPFWDRWAAQEAALFGALDPRSQAHVVIDTSDL